MKKILLTTLVLISICSFGRNYNSELLTIKGVTTDGMFENSENLLDVSIYIYEYNDIIATYNCNENGEFDFTIPTNSYITIEFNKEGFITKRILVDTDTDLYIKKKKVFDFEVTLLKDENGIEIGDMDFPMAIIRYDGDKNNFTITNRSFTIAKLKNEVSLEETNVHVPMKNGKLIFQ